MDKNFLVVANWKANSVDLPKWFDELAISEKAPEIAIAPAYYQLGTLNSQLENYKFAINLAAQNVSSFPTGAFTGEISAQMLKDAGAKYCLIGHSERRKYLHETNDDINLKYEALTKENIIPIVCAQSFEEIPQDIFSQTSETGYVMFEPFEAISSDSRYKPESPENIAQTIVDWETKLPENIRFLYGGSVNPENCANIISFCPQLSGLVVGHASLDPITFGSVINLVLQNS